MKKYIKSPILWGVIAVFLVISVASCVVYGIQKRKERIEEARRLNEEWAERHKYPWRTMELKSNEDVIIGNMNISSSNLSEEEKQAEAGKLWHRWYIIQQGK